MMSIRLSSKRLRQLGQFVSLFCLCFTLVVGCSNNQSTEPSAPSGEQSDRITLGTTLKPRTLDPADTYELAGINVIYNVGETLYTYELGTTELKPQLAIELPQVSANGMTYTIPLREGVTFHDGTPFNAEAMAFSLNRFIENGGKPSFLLSDTVESVTATGEYELTITLKKPFAAFPSLLAFPGTVAVSPQAYEIGAGSFNPNQLVSTGPYQLAQFSSDSIRLDVFDQYWGEQPENAGVDMQIYDGNSANLYNSFRTGAIDVAYQSLDPEQIKSLIEGAEQDQWQMVEGSGTAVNFLVLNRNQKPLDQPEVRQAIAAMMDRSLLNERVLQGQGEPVYSLIPTAFDVYQPAFQEAYGDANIEQAKELLAEAGYTPENPAVIELWHSSGSATRGITAATLKALAEKELDGAIQFEPRAVEFATASKNLKEGIYPTFLADWYPDFLDADNYVQPFLDCAEGSQAQGCQSGGAQAQGSFYYSDRINELIDQQRQEQDPAARQEIFAEIQQILAEDVPYIPILQSKDYAFAQNNVEGVTINPSQSFPFWTIERSESE
ncbi:MAG: ABC transporter substrate-binding protein [Cyanophyceae cyanobacterium]